ncbi:MAG TPA: hyalin, partial [Gammaproteobacteria bacterium]|nr:hyalin [Gammaproteobacteria bacterium]
ELWKTDGTQSGTAMVADINIGGAGSDPAYLTDVNGELFFAATDGSSGVELFHSDGTASGTNRVKDINSGGGSDPRFLTAFNGRVYFSANDGIHGRELWKASTATANLIDLNSTSTSASSNPQNFQVVGGLSTLFFAADRGSGVELFKSNAGGTGIVKDINGSGSSNPRHLTDYGGTLVFSADDGSSGAEPWKSDGTPGGTGRIADINQADGIGSDPAAFTPFEGQLLFTADDGAGAQLWRILSLSAVLPEAKGPAAGSDPGELAAL